MTPPMLSPLNAKRLPVVDLDRTMERPSRYRRHLLVAAQPPFPPELLPPLTIGHGADATDQAPSAATARTAPMIVVCANPIDL